MTYQEALKINPGSKVIVKKTGKRITITAKHEDKKRNNITFECDDRDIYHHTYLTPVKKA